MTSPRRIEALSLHHSEEVGDGFLRIVRVTISNQYADGTSSPPYVAEYVTRPKGLDGVVVVVWRSDSSGGEPWVLLRTNLRPGVALGRVNAPIAVPDAAPSIALTEVVAGIVEASDLGLDGLVARVCAEVREEAGYSITGDHVTWLGNASFPSPGVMPEKHYYAAVRITEATQYETPEGDGSPFEEGAVTRWMPLREAIAGCERGAISDAKSELALHRFAAWYRRTTKTP